MPNQQVPVAKLKEQIGAGPKFSSWMQIDQDRINSFADATLDHQFIHIDEKKAAPIFGSTIAHGFLTLSLLPHLTGEVAVFPEGTKMAVNYGLDYLRFLAPVKVGSKIRAAVSMVSVEERNPGQHLIKNKVEVEIEGEKKPAMVAQSMTLFFT